jgi:hypothetical protein
MAQNKLKDFEIHGIKITCGLKPVAHNAALIVADRTVTLYSPTGRPFATSPITQVRVSAHRLGRSRVHLTVRDLRFTLNGAGATGSGPGWFDMSDRTGFAIRFLTTMARSGAAVRRQLPRQP